MSNKRRVPKAPTPTAGLPAVSPWPKRLGWASGVGLVVALVAVVFLSQPEIRGVPEGTQTIQITDNQHVTGTIYAADEVPAGGQMDAAWQNCGFYEIPVRAESAVHSLEHGAVWVAFDPDLSDDDIASLRRYAGRSEKVLISPVPGIDSPIIVSAWGFQMDIDDLDDSRLDQFVNEFSGSSSAPEPGGRCSGAVGQPQF